MNIWSVTMNKENLFKKRIICCDTCLKQIHTHCDNNVKCFEYEIDYITKTINGEMWSGRFPNKYIMWKPRIYYLEDNLFEI